MPRQLRIEMDYNKCVGSTLCMQLAPKSFALNEEGQAKVLDPAAETEERILDAAEQCPLMAITVRDAETGEQLFP